MSIIKVKAIDSGFSLVPNITAKAKMSWQAKGMLIYLCSHSEDWQVSIQDLIKQTEGTAKNSRRDSVKSTINELCELGYMRKTQARNRIGKFDCNDYEVSLLPIEIKEKDPITEKPLTGKPLTGNPPLLNKDINQKKNTPNITNPMSSKLDAVEIIKHLNQVCGTRFQTTNKSALGFISERMKEGFSKEDLKAVIESKFSEWGNDDKMRTYLRPQTLFNVNKFPAYLAASSNQSNYSGLSKITQKNLSNLEGDW